MFCLGIETSSPLGSVALTDEVRFIDEIVFEEGLMHGKELVPRIKAILERNSIKRDDVGLYCVSVGPGSYTGMRVGLVTAKLLAYTLGKPMIGVPSLDAMAMNVPAGHDRVAAVVDARWDEVYLGMYERSGAGWKRTGEFIALPPAEAVARIPQGTFVFGDALKRYENAFSVKGRFELGADPAIWHPRARNICTLGYAEYLRRGEDDLHKLKPLYLKQGI